MGTTQRAQPWKYGDVDPMRTPAIGTAVLIAKGDLVAQAPSGGVTGATSAATIAQGEAYPASDQPWDTSLAVTQEAFHDAFLGVSAQKSASGDVDPITVNQAGVHEFDCASASFNHGDLVGPAKQSGNLLEDQKVVAVATANLAIGRVQGKHTSVTKVLVRVFGVKGSASGGVQAPA